MRYVVERMTMADIPRIVEVERLAYTTPWPPSAYRKELEENQHAYYIVVRDTSMQPINEVEPVTQPIQPRRPFPLSLLQGRLPFHRIRIWPLSWDLLDFGSCLTKPISRPSLPIPSTEVEDSASCCSAR